MEDRIRLSVLGVTPTQTQTGAFALILGEEEGTRRLPIIVGQYEAQGIIVQYEKIRPPRPLTLDLLAGLIDIVGLKVIEVSIIKLENGVFFSEIMMENKAKNLEIVMDSRTSDAIQLALKFSVPIFTNETVMKKAGITIHEIDKSEEHGHQQSPPHRKEEKTTPKPSKAPDFLVPANDLSLFADSDIKKYLDIAIKREDYEMAELLKEEIAKRSLPH
ncbi:MAG: bifunctional nuclease family protein [Bacteroidales bacterium]